MEKSSLVKMVAVSAVTAVVTTSLMAVIFAKMAYRSQYRPVAKEMQEWRSKMMQGYNTAPKTTAQNVVQEKPIAQIEGSIFTDEAKGFAFVPTKECSGMKLTAKSSKDKAGNMVYTVNYPAMKEWPQGFARVYSAVTLNDYNKESEAVQAALAQGEMAYSRSIVATLRNNMVLLVTPVQDGPDTKCGVDIKTF